MNRYNCTRLCSNVFVLLFATFLLGCVHPLTITSDPAGASAYCLDGLNMTRSVGRTPVTCDVWDDWQIWVTWSDGTRSEVQRPGRGSAANFVNARAQSQFPNGIRTSPTQTFAVRVTISSQSGFQFRDNAVVHQKGPQLIVDWMNREAGYDEFRVADGETPQIIINLVEIAKDEGGPYGARITVFGLPSSAWFGSGNARAVQWFQTTLETNYVTAEKLDRDTGATITQFLNNGWH